MKIPFLDLKATNDKIKEEIEQAILETVHSGWYILGQKCKSFEEELKTYLIDSDEGYAVGCNSGTDALILALLASGVGQDDEVIVVSNTAIPTVAAIVSVGAKPVFVDINSQTWLMDISKVSEKVTKNTKAIIPVHLYGNMVDVFSLEQELLSIERQDISIIEDVAQAHGSTLQGNQAGTIGRFGAFSFYPSKNIGALGDAGAVFCKTEEDYQALCTLRNYGQKDRYNAVTPRGLNSRLDEIQAAVLSVKLKYLDQWNLLKAKQMQYYRAELQSLPISFQEVTKRCIPAWHLCVVRCETEEVKCSLQKFLNEKEIQTLIHYPIPTHVQPAFEKWGTEVLPITETFAKQILSIPLNTVLSDQDQQYIIKNLGVFFA